MRRQQRFRLLQPGSTFLQTTLSLYDIIVCDEPSDQHC